MKNTRKRGHFIVFEGIDGSGKTTQIKKLQEYLESRGRKVFVTAEPTVSSTGGALRDALSGIAKKNEYEMAAMFVLDRIFHNTNEVWGIEKMLSEGYDVLCDRYYYSSMAYQGSATDFEWVKAMNLLCPEIRTPDACLFLDLTPQESLERIFKGRATTEIYENEDKLAEVRNSFFRVFKTLGDRENIFIVSAAGTVDEVAKAIRRCVETLL